MPFKTFKSLDGKLVLKENAKYFMDSKINPKAEWSKKFNKVIKILLKD